MTTLTNEQLEIAYAELANKFKRLEELVLQEQILQVYICDKNSFDMYKILEMLFTSPQNIATIENTLSDPEDIVIFKRIVAKWNPVRQVYNH